MASIIPLFGLRNDSAFCYFNSLIQALVSCEKLNNILLSFEPKKEYNIEKSIYASYFNFLTKVIQDEQVRKINEDGRIPTINLRGLKRVVINTSNGLFQVGEQGDSSELLITFLDAIHEDIKEKWNSSSLPMNIERTDLNSSGTSLENYIKSYATGYSPIAKLFHIQIKTTLRCSSCGHNLNKYETSSVLNLEVIPNVSRLEDCLDANFGGNPETLDGYRCDACQCISATKRINSLSYIPLYFIIVLKKYSNPHQVITCPIDNLPVYKYFHKEDLQRLNQVHNCSMEEKYFYELNSAIIHLGGLRGGHYNLFTKRNKKWYHIDDECLREVPEMNSKYLSRAYILIYYRRHKKMSS